MDSQGFVFLSVLAKFNRIRQLTQDMELLRYVCVHSPQIEFRVGSDGYDRLRKREGWQQWVLAMEERDQSVQNDGPSQVQEPFLHTQPFYEAPYNLGSQQIIPPRSESTNRQQSSDAGALPYVAASPSRPAANDGMNVGVDSLIPLPAADLEATSGMLMLNNTDKTFADRYPRVENTFTDEQVDLLMIVVRKPLNQTMQVPPPFHSAASRTFSNGSIDGRTINDELTTPKDCEKFASVNGDNASDV